MSAPPSASSPHAPHGRPFSRRSLLVAALAGTALAVTGCTGDPGDDADAVTPAQADQLDAQVQVQATLVAAFERAFAASPELAADAAALADQAHAQLDRLQAAAPSSTAAPRSPAAGSAAAATTSAGPAGDVAPDPAAARAYLRAQVAAAADAHAAACPDFSGARAALLGSIAAGLRGQDGVLA